MIIIVMIMIVYIFLSLDPRDTADFYMGSATMKHWSLTRSTPPSIRTIDRRWKPRPYSSLHPYIHLTTPINPPHTHPGCHTLYQHPVISHNISAVCSGKIYKPRPRPPTAASPHRGQTYKKKKLQLYCVRPGAISFVERNLPLKRSFRKYMMFFGWY